MATEVFLIRFTQQGAQQVTQGIASIEASAKKSADALAFFRKALVALSFARVITAATDFLDTAARLDNRLRVATKSTEDFERAQSFLSKITRESRTDLEANTLVYARLQQSTASLGYSTEFLEKVQTGLTYAVKVGGATTQEARNSLIQFSQSLASGALRGDELRSVAEQLPSLARSIEKEFNIAQGSLAAFARENPGILKTARVLQAVANEAANLQSQAAKITPTLAEGFNVVRQRAIELVREINNGTGVLGLLTRAVIFFGDNLKTIVEISAVFLALWAANRIAGIISNFLALNNVIIRLVLSLRLATAAQTLLNAVMMANPILFVITVIGTLISIFIVLYNSSETFKNAVDSLFGVLVKVGQFIAGIFTPAFRTIGEIWNVLIPFGRLLAEAFTKIWEIIGPLVEQAARFSPVFGPLVVIFENLGGAADFLAKAFVFLVVQGLTPMVSAIVGATNVLEALGLVQKSTADEVRKAAGEFFKLAFEIQGADKWGKENTKTASELQSAMFGSTGATKGAAAATNGYKASLDGLYTSQQRVADYAGILANEFRSYSFSADAARIATERKEKALKAEQDRVQRLQQATAYLNNEMLAGTGLAPTLAVGINAVASAAASAASEITTAGNALATFLNIGSGFNDWFGSGQASGTKATIPLYSKADTQQTAAAQAVLDQIKALEAAGGTGYEDAKARAQQVVSQGIGNTIRGPGISIGARTAPGRVFGSGLRGTTSGFDSATGQAFNAVAKAFQKLQAKTVTPVTTDNTNAITNNTTAIGALGGAAMSLTGAIDQNTQAQINQIKSLYDMLDLARQNVSPYYGQTDQSLGKEMAYKNLIGFARGGSGLVGGQPGVDKNLVQFMASRGEEVNVLTRAQQRNQAEGGSATVIQNTINLYGVEDFDSFERNSGQLARAVSRGNYRSAKKLGLQ